MLDPMEGHGIVFKGTGGSECEAFIVAIRDLAFGKGLEEDHHWMLHFATTRLRGQALRWHARLDSSVKKDWELFVQALFDQYPPVEDPGETGMDTPKWASTTFSPSISSTSLPQGAANHPNASPSRFKTTQEAIGIQFVQQKLENLCRGYERLPSALGCYRFGVGQQFGRLRIVNEEGATPHQYIWWGHTREEAIELGTSSIDEKRTTLNRDEALIVSFLPSLSPHRISCLNSRANITALAVYFTPEDTTKSYNLSGVSKPGMNPLRNAHGYASKIWNVLEGGILQASISTFSRNRPGVYEEAKFSTTEVHVNTAGQSICFAKPGALLPQDRPNFDPFHPFVRALIIFEPL